MRRFGGLAVTLLLVACGDEGPEVPFGPPAPGPPAQLRVVSGAGQAAPIGETLPEALVVAVLDDRSRPVAGEVVRWEAVRGGGAVLEPETRTDGDGLARTRAVVGGEAFENLFVASADAIPGSSQVFRAFYDPPPPGRLVVRASVEGTPLDPDGFAVTVDGAEAAALGPRGGEAVLGLAPGPRSVGLAGLAAHCVPTTASPVQVTVFPEGSGHLEWRVRCTGAERLEGRIAFVSERGGSPDVWVMVPDGSGLLNLTHGFEGRAPDVSPDGRRVVFTSSERWGVPDVYVMRADGTEITNLTNDGFGAQFDPTWSPDGTRIAFVADARIRIMAADGSEVVTITPEPAAARNDPTWSPDGQRVAWTEWRFGAARPDIRTARADGSDPVDLTADPGTDAFPRWSPDGGRIAFASDRDGDLSVYAMDADGGNVVRLTVAPGSEWPGGWSPDGARIAFTAESAGGTDVWVMDADGSNAVRLTADPAADRDPAWSP